MSAYSPHEAHVAPARHSSALFHTIVGFCAIEFFYQLGAGALYFLFDNIARITGAPVLEPGTRPEVLINLASFGLLAGAVFFVVWMTHHRGPRSLLGDLSRLWPDFRRATFAALLVFLVVEGMSPFWWGDSGIRQALGPWLLYLPWALLMLLVQVTAEEIFYRGYLQQQIAARYSNPLVWLVVPNIAFAAVHWSNGGGTADSTEYVIWAFCFGLAASDLVARTGSLGAAIGLHFVNNIFAFVVVGASDDLDSALALYLLPPSFGLPEDLVTSYDTVSLAFFATDLLIIGLAWLAIRIAVRR